MKRHDVSHRRYTPAAIGVIIAIGALTAACQKHEVTAFHPCAQATKTVIVSERGAIGLAKIGLTPENLKQQEECP